MEIQDLDQTQQTSGIEAGLSIYIMMTSAEFPSASRLGTCIGCPLSLRYQKTGSTSGFKLYLSLLVVSVSMRWFCARK